MPLTPLSGIMTVGLDLLAVKTAEMVNRLCKEKAVRIGMDKEKKTNIINEYARHNGDTGSPSVQVALITNRILQLTDHLRVHKHDESSRRGLLKLVGQRRRLLNYIRRNDYQRYLALTEKLNIRRKA